jgi:hypothetical protein
MRKAADKNLDQALAEVLFFLVDPLFFFVLSATVAVRK